MSFQPAGVQVKVVPSPPLVGLIDTLVMDGGVLDTVTAMLGTAAPFSRPSLGVAVTPTEFPLSKLAPPNVFDVAPGTGVPFTVHCQDTVTV